MKFFEYYVESMQSMVVMVAIVAWLGLIFVPPVLVFAQHLSPIWLLLWLAVPIPMILLDRYLR